MPGKRPHYNLAAWQEAIALVKLIYTATSRFPKEELYGLTAQIRRCAVSIPSNLAEGAARTSRKEFAQFLSFAKGSLSELETQLLIAVELGFLNPQDGVFDSLEVVSKLFSGLHRKLIK
ncbi:MAG: four helix bundle protein [Burkholderiales bacterium]